MNTSKLTIGQRKFLLESLENQESPMTDAEKKTLQSLIPTIEIIEVKRKRDVNTECPWDKVITTYKSCTLRFCTDGKYKRVELPMAKTYITNQRIKEYSYGYNLIK